MAKKNWIKIKRGLVDDPRHRGAIGEAIWLYFHIIDRADFDTGTVYDWKDLEEANAMQLPVKTLRNQRRKLEAAGYIRTEQGQHSQQIVVIKWINPRGYSGEVINAQDAHLRAPSEVEGYHQGAHQGAHLRAPSSLLSHETNDHEETTHMSNRPDVQVVFDYWQVVHGKGRSKLDEKRRRAIAARLRQYSIDDLKAAVDGCKRSVFHQGGNDRNQIYDDIELICRDAKHVDQFIALSQSNGNGRTNERPSEYRPTDSRSSSYTIPKPANTLSLRADDEE